MTMTIPTHRRASGVPPTPAQELQTRFAAVKISFTWLGVRKTLSPDQKAQAADSFGAEGQFLSAGKKLLDTRDEHFQVVTALRHRISSYWKSLSLPDPEPGLRLIRHADIEPFDRQMTRFQDSLAEAVSELNRNLESLKSDARLRLGSLYNPNDYPATLIGQFGVEWQFPSVSPPDYLRQLNPQLFQQEQHRMQARFEEAVQLAEQAFTGELAKLIEHLSERLTASPDGQKKVFRDSAITNLTEFFQRFKKLNIRSNEELDRLVESAQQVVQGIKPSEVRDNDQLRQHVAAQLAGVQSVLDGLLVDAPRRKILRPQVS